MAKFDISVAGTSGAFVVNKITPIETDCSSIFKYSVIATSGDSITITLDGLEENSTYTLNGVTTPFTDTITLVFNNTLGFEFSIQNSGDPGVFDYCNVSVANNTTLETYNLFAETVTRSNDNAKCDSGEINYDDLLDTPETKIGNEGKYIRVSDDGLTHEYVDAVPGDATYVHPQSVASATWTIPHTLGKFPSVRIKDGLGNTVYGEIDDVDTSNMIITFNTAFAGVAYLN